MQQLIITFDETNGNINVNGPVNNKGLCYMMLECARDAVKDHVDTSVKPAPFPVPIPDAVPPPNGRILRQRVKRRR